MLQRVAIEGVKLPRLYIAEDAADARLAQMNGIPYIRWTQGMDTMIRYLLRPTIERMFPGINWDAVLGKRPRIRSKVFDCSGSTDDGEHQIADHDAEAMLASQHEHDAKLDSIERESIDAERPVDSATGLREFAGDRSSMGYDAFQPDRIPLLDYVGDLSSSVDIEVLQQLGMLPQFLGDIADCIRRNIGNSMYWTEGYNKKLGAAIGRFGGRPELPNLIILDVSASIPDGIAATMLQLVDTLRTQCNAELIITGSRSGYYPANCVLPKPQTLRDYYKRAQEGAEFYGILNKYISGRKFGHVISFGDNDSPGNAIRWTKQDAVLNLSNVVVHEVHHYHTRRETSTGYALWANDCNPDRITYDKSWCSIMNKNYQM